MNPPEESSRLPTELGDPRPSSIRVEVVAKSHPKFPALDGLRGVAILLVVLAHAEVPGMLPAAGSAGVTVFFVLSGFLITYLLLREFKTFGNVDYRAFYIRRALRLLQALIVLLCVITLAWSIAKPSNRWGLFGVSVPALFYVANWTLLSNGWSSPLSHTWSLSVEEQFYLLWPLLVVFVRRLRLRYTLLALGSAIVMSGILRIWFLSRGGMPGHLRGYIGTDTNAYALLLGAVVAVIAMQGRNWIRPPPWVAPTVLVALLVSSCVTWGLPQLGGDQEAMYAPLAGALTALLVVLLLSGNRVFEMRFLRYAGRISYGWYLWQSPFLWIVHKSHNGSLLATATAVMVSFAVAALSYRFIKRPFLKAKGRFGARKRSSKN